MKSEGAIKFQVLGLVFALENSKGHLKWTVSGISRKLGISRALIYYHFGNSKTAILDSCYQLVAEEFYGLQHIFEGIFAGENDLFERALYRTQRLYLKIPAIVTFYHRWRFESSPNQKRILEMEKRYQAKLQKALAKLSHEEILAVHTIIHGVVTSPFASKESIGMVAKRIKLMAKKGA